MMQRNRLVQVSLGVWLVLGLAAASPGQDKRPMSLIDLLEVPGLGDPRLSPDGSELIYLLARADWEENNRPTHLWRVGEDPTSAVQLTFGEKGERDARWSPDGRFIAFLAQRGDVDETQIHLLPTAGGEARPLTRHETSVSQLAWSADGTYLYFLAADPKSEEEKARDKAKDDVLAYDEDYKQRHLWRISVAEGEEERLTEGAFSVLGFHLSRDGSRLVHHRAPTPLYDDSDEGEIWVMGADGSEPRRLTRNQVPERGAELSPDNQTVLFLTSTNAEFEPYYNNNLFLVPAVGGPHRLLLADMPHEVQSASWSADGESIYFTANTGVRSQLFRVDVASQELVQLTHGDHSVRQWSYVPGIDTHVFSLAEPTNPGDVKTLTSGSSELRPRTRVFAYLDQEFRLPRQEAIRWPGADGTEVEGLLTYPLDYRGGQRYPLVVQTHGGPAASDKFGFDRWVNYSQVLAAMGYMVFKPNYRGSTGYGDDYLRDMVGHYYQNAHLDVMTGVDHLIERGLVDGDRMAKMGWSGGGHMTNKIITHTDRFKAASSGAGAVNWVSMYAQSDVRIYRTPWFGGTPWEKDAPIDLYWEHSPLKDIWKVKTPTLILVGEKDVRVPPPQSLELLRALKSNGVPTHLYMAPREPHGWRELRHQLFKMNVELEWFERHVRGREYVWVNAPGDEEPES